LERPPLGSSGIGVFHTPYAEFVRRVKRTDAILYDEETHRLVVDWPIA
jgi:hypothetical protein